MTSAIIMLANRGAAVTDASWDAFGPGPVFAGFDSYRLTYFMPTASSVSRPPTAAWVS